MTFILLSTGIIAGSFTGLLPGVAVAQSARNDDPLINRSKLKFRLGTAGIAAKPAAKPQRAAIGVANPLKLPYVPLPRYKPGTPSFQRTPSPTRPQQLIQANRRGEVSIVLNQLKRERDQTAARELRPTLKTTWSSAQLASAAKRCDLVMATTNIDAKRLAPIGGSGGCGIAAPLLISSFGAVKVVPPAKLNCNLALATYKWITDKVQPLARKKYKSAVVSMRQLSSFSCRSRRGSGTSRISEHSFGNALDIGSFTLATGKKISVLKDWSTAGAIFGIGRDANFLDGIHAGACDSYATVLSPRYNKAHANHFHMDMGRSGRYKICK